MKNLYIHPRLSILFFGTSLLLGTTSFAIKNDPHNPYLEETHLTRAQMVALKLGTKWRALTIKRKIARETEEFEKKHAELLRKVAEREQEANQREKEYHQWLDDPEVCAQEANVMQLKATLDLEKLPLEDREPLKKLFEMADKRIRDRLERDKKFKENTDSK